MKNPWNESATLSLEAVTDKLRDELITGQSEVLLGAEVVKNAPSAIKAIPKVEVLTTSTAVDAAPAGKALSAVAAGSEVLEAVCVSRI